MGYNRVQFMKKIMLSVLSLMISTFIFAQHTITITLTTDQYGSETTWRVFDVANNNAVIAQGGPYTNVSQAQTIAPISVDGTGCYVFVIYDEYGDGMQAGYGNGSYTVSYDGVQVASGGNFGSYAQHHVGGDGCPTDDIAMVQITSAPYCQLSNTLTITGIMGSYGISATSYDVTYKIDNGDWVTDHNVTCNIGMYETHTFTHNIPASFTTAGSHTVTVKVHNPNGVTDENPTDNELSFDVTVYENAIERKVLLEHFTTAQCPNCPAATQNLTTWMSSRPNVAWMAHHVGYYTDAFTVSESNTMIAFYNAGGSTYAPAIMLDRTYISSTGEPGPVFFPSASITPALIDAQLAVPSFVSLDIEGTLSENEQYINVTVSGEFVADVNLGNLKLSVYITEDGLAGAQAGASNYTHNHVVRDALSATIGDDVFTSTTAGSTFSKTYTYRLNDSWKPENCKVIAFVNNWDPQNVNNREVLNTEFIDVSALSVDIDENNLNNLSIYPNPANNVVNVYAPGMEKVEILNSLGQVVYNSNMVNTEMQINIESLTEGIYFIRVSGAQGSKAQKLIKK